MNSDDLVYEIDSSFYRVGQVNDIELSVSESGLTRKVLRAEIVQNPQKPENRVRACLVHQKRHRTGDDWDDIDGPSLKQTSFNSPSKFHLDSSETHKAFDHLINLYKIGEEGVHRGKEFVRMTEPSEWIRVGTKRAELIAKLVEGEHGEEVWEQLVKLQPGLSSKLAVARIHEMRRKALQEFESAISEARGEDHWKQFLRKHRWVFGSANVGIIDEGRIDIKHIADIPFEVAGGFMDIVELKRPDLPFWAQTSGSVTVLYRKKFLLPHWELEGAISQTANYVLQAEKHVADTDFLKTHGVKPLKPRGLVVHGRSIDWGDREWQEFRLLNDRLHGIQVITFDHLLEQARRSVELE